MNVMINESNIPIIRGQTVQGKVYLSIYLLLFSFFTVYTILPIYSTFNDVFRYICIICSILFSIFYYKNGFIGINLKNIVYVIGLFILSYLINVLIKYDFTIISAIHMYISMMPIIVGRNLMLLNSKERVPLRIVFLLVLTITIITSIIGLFEYPEASRLLSGTAGDGLREDNDFYSSINIIGFGFVSAIPVLMSVILDRIHSVKKIKKITYYVIFFSLLFLLFLAQYAIAFICCLAMITIHIICYLFKKKTLMALIVVPLIIVVVVLLYVFFLPKLVEKLYELNLSILAFKLDSFITSLSGQASRYTEARSAAYGKSIDIILSHPFLGALINNQELGGHSSVFDLLASSGLFGFLIVSGFLFFLLQKGSFNYKNIALVFAMIFTATLNPIFGNYVIWYFAIIGTCLL